MENAHIAAVVICLSVGILAVLCLLSHIRVDKEEQITPLCPQLIVKGNKDLRFRFVLDAGDDTTEIYNADTDEFLCRVVTDSYDPLRPAFSGVAATVRLQDRVERTLATIVARSVAVQGQGICVCRAGCEIFGFVEPDEKREGRYSICHRSGVTLLTLDGDWISHVGRFQMVNPAGLPVFTMQKTGNVCEGEVHHGTDAGLMLCTLFAAHVNRQLLAKEMPSPWGHFPAFSSTPAFAPPLSAPLGMASLQTALDPPPQLAPGSAAGSSERGTPQLLSPRGLAPATSAAGGTGGTGRGSGKGGSRQIEEADGVLHAEAEGP